MIVGLDGRQKMSKSADNHIEIASSPDEIRERVNSAFTDPQRVRKSDPGRPEICNVYSLRRIFTPDRVEEVAAACRSAEIGCVQCKKELAEAIADYFGPFRERREQLARRPEYVREVIEDGARRASVAARATIEEVKTAMHLK